MATDRMGVDPSVGDAAVDVDPRHELRDAPPFFGWNRIYLIVVGALFVEIVAFWIITSVFQ
ncbi:MAG TPA: hypothetical protein VH374_07720 [Polyangia bacterium]|nr:hypothetical protein [Polyangia bacterium]